jgi:ATP-binding cassette subfamily B protein
LERNDIYSSLWYQQNTHLTPAARTDKPNFRSPTLVS